MNTKSMQKKVCYGTVPPIITPVNDKEKVDEAGFRALLRYCVDSGMHGIFVAGSNGECMALTQAERDRAISIALDECRGAVPVVAGVMDTSTTRVIENVKRLEQMGGEYAVITPVFYARHASPAETVRHFETISRQTNAKLIIYNIPMFTGCMLKPETIFELAKIDKVVGYKDSGGSLPDFLSCIEHFKNTDFFLLQGTANLGAVSMLAGGDGYVPSLAPVFPALYNGVYEHARNGDTERLFAWNDVMMQAQKLLGMGANATSVTKYAISLLGHTDPRVIEPSLPLTDAEEQRIEEHIVRVNHAIQKLKE